MSTSKPSKAIQKALAVLEKRGLRRPGKREIEFMPTGLIGLDKSIGGGLVKGRVYEVAGQESAGKTTLILECIKSVQSMGLAVAYNDYEHALDMRYVEDMGVDVSEDAFIFEQPDTLEDGMAVSATLIETGAIGMVVDDSVAAMVSKLENELTEIKKKDRPAVVASKFGPRLRQYIGLLNRSNTIGVFINQVRADFGTWGTGITTPGGKALKFFASARLFLSAGKSKIYEDGIHTRVRVWKNKQSADQRGVSEYEIRPSLGIVREEELLAIAKEKGIISERGGFFKVEDQEKRIRGRAKILEMLKDEQVKQRILEAE